MVRFLSWERTLSYLILITYLLGSRSFVMDRALFFLTFITEGRAGRHSPPASSLRTASIYLLKRFPFNNSAGETHAINHHHHHHHPSRAYYYLIHTRTCKNQTRPFYQPHISLKTIKCPLLHIRLSL